ncbi:unnamed protein product [Boreogadus saida]
MSLTYVEGVPTNMSSPSLPMVSQWLAFGVNRTLVRVISGMVEKDLGERNLGFDSLKNMNCDMLPAGGCREAPPPRSTTARQRAVGYGKPRAT